MNLAGDKLGSISAMDDLETFIARGTCSCPFCRLARFLATPFTSIHNLFANKAVYYTR